MEQTAVEWLALRYHHRQGYLSLEDIAKAKAMEKEQIINAYVECWKSNMPDGYECKQSAEEYYNETNK
jgi:HEPN domain-containing protein